MMRHRKPNLIGIFKRFNINCIGKQLTFEMMRANKAAKYNELRKRRFTPVFEWWFLRYIPHLKNQRTNSRSRLKTMKRIKKRQSKRKNKTRKK
jgi:hypothetical protein